MNRFDTLNNLFYLKNQFNFQKYHQIAHLLKEGVERVQFMNENFSRLNSKLKFCLQLTGHCLVIGLTIWPNSKCRNFPAKIMATFHT